MKILIIGERENFVELKLKLGENQEYTFLGSATDSEDDLDTFDIIFDFVIEDSPEIVELYNPLNTPVFLNTVKITLAEIKYLYGLSANVFGFNGLRTFVNRDQIEVTSLKENKESLNKLLSDLEIDFSYVDDRVGMVTPRIIFMIINEAFYTVQEGTASREDIDQGMKLGTNYPYGPFEWAKKIGISDIYETLEALYEATKEERYKICPLLKKEYLLQ